LAEAMRARYTACGLAPPASLKRLAEGAATWTAGHQLVAAGGPAFFHLKILSMVRRARLQAEAPVVVFWLASEDHDWEEVRHFPRVHGVGKEFAWPEAACGGAVGRWELDDRARATAREWAASVKLPESWKRPVLDALDRSQTLGEAVFRWVHEWFGEDGVLVLDADDPDLKAWAAPLWEAELRGEGIGQPLARQTAYLEQAGWKPGLFPREVALFELRPGERVRLESGPQGTSPVDGRWTLAPADASQVASEARWSPNAALRPLYQEWLLGNDAVFLGPSELAYWLQLTQAFAHHGLAFPRLELRDGGVAVSPPQWAWLQSQNWHPQEGVQGIEARWRSACIQGAESALPVWDFTAWADEFVAHVKPLDPTLEGAARAAVKKMEKAFEGAAGKVRRAWRAQHSNEESFIQTLVERLAPESTPQERVEHLAAWGEWKAVRAGWCAQTVDAPVFSVWVADDSRR
jgi:uncharacterized protein YllA (UPF0747 family)